MMQHNRPPQYESSAYVVVVCANQWSVRSRLEAVAADAATAAVTVNL